VTLNGDIFIDDGDPNGRVQKWKAEANTFDIVYVAKAFYIK